MIYSKKFQEFLNKLSQNNFDEYQKIEKDIKVLAKLYTQKEQQLTKITRLSEQQQIDIVNLNKELDNYKQNFEKKVEQEIEKQKIQTDIFYEQSRLASIATMLDAVAHQWVQPLYLLTIQIELLNLEADKNSGLSKEKVAKFKKESQAQIEHMKQTLINFREFFKPLSDKIDFSIADNIKEALELINPDIQHHNINVILNVKQDFHIKGNPNEFKHIIINIINNAKEQFLNNNISNRTIHINICKEKKIFEITDNAGGIHDDIIDNIFDLHISSKDNQSGGMGLYLSQQIANKHNGIISVSNTNNGAKFIFSLMKYE
jgi:signal transduction histidine kinase